MIVSHETEAISNTIESPEVKNAAMKMLIGAEEGWSDHVMRVIELGPEGYSPKHTHPWPHINYMVEGKGILQIEDREHVVEAGSYAYVPADKLHQFKNAGEGMFRFICIVPKEGHQ